MILRSNHFIASYESTNADLKDKVIISNSGINLSYYGKSPNFTPDSSINIEFLDNIQNNIYLSQSLIHHGDTISLLSFNNYPKLNSAIYLLNNGIPTDSIINKFIIMEMIPVPLSSENEIVYMAKSGIPDTDHLWSTLIGIELHSMKCKIYNSNRFQQE